MITKRIKSFTLAEVLITLVIIGVVAALTIPNLMQKYQEQTTVKKVQKFYSNLSNAYILAEKENGPASDWGFLTSTNVQNREKMYNYIFKPYFKIAKDCGTSTAGNCLANTYTTLNKYSTIASYENTYKLALDDGSTVLFYTVDNGASVLFLYDFNGVKGPNQWGIDAFYFVLISNRIVPAGIQSGNYAFSRFNSSCKKNDTSSKQGLGCTAWVIYKGNMDYLHCDLTWDKNGCKDN